MNNCFRVLHLRCICGKPGYVSEWYIWYDEFSCERNIGNKMIGVIICEYVPVFLLWSLLYIWNKKIYPGSSKISWLLYEKTIMWDRQEQYPPPPLSLYLHTHTHTRARTHTHRYTHTHTHTQTHTHSISDRWHWIKKAVN